jgi:hypothetical protein
LFFGGCKYWLVIFLSALNLFLFCMIFRKVMKNDRYFVCFYQKKIFFLAVGYFGVGNFVDVRTVNLSILWIAFGSFYCFTYRSSNFAKFVIACRLISQSNLSRYSRVSFEKRNGHLHFAAQVLNYQHSTCLERRR